MSLIGKLFGWLMYLIYQVIPNYGICIIIFTIIVKLLTLPSTYKMQVNQARQSLLSDKVNKLKKSYANNQQRFQEEQQKLFQEEGINPSAGCLGTILTLILVLGVYQVVLRPLTYILRIPADQLTEAKGLLSQWLLNEGIYDAVDKAEKAVNARPELLMLRYVKTNPEIFSSLNGFADKLTQFKFNFLGFDLAGIPSMHPENGWSFTAVMLIVLPVLAAVIQLVMTIITQRHSKKVNPDVAQQMGGMNLMLYASPLMTIWIGMSVPAGLSFYWLCNSLIALVVQLGLYKYLSGDRLIAINEKAKKKQLAKGTTWMQRMMEQSAQYQAEMNGTARTDANRTRYTDGDDGMSRKERAEYEKALIEAARKRTALKYGDEAANDSSNTDNE